MSCTNIHAVNISCSQEKVRIALYVQKAALQFIDGMLNIKIPAHNHTHSDKMPAHNLLI